MGAIEDVRKALQDIVAPDLKALQVEVKEGFASVERVAAIRHELLLAELRTSQVIAESRHEAILRARALDIDKRLERVEVRQAFSAGHRLERISCCCIRNPIAVVILAQPESL